MAETHQAHCVECTLLLLWVLRPRAVSIADVVEDFVLSGRPVLIEHEMVRRLVADDDNAVVHRRCCMLWCCVRACYSAF